MPERSLRPCPHPGCRELTRGGKCALHRAAESAEREHGAHDKLYSQVRWVRFRENWLQRFPLCGMREDRALHADDSICARDGRSVLGRIVDHIVPHRGDDFLFLSDSNVQTLCSQCHNRKTAMEIQMRKRNKIDLQSRIERQGGDADMIDDEVKRAEAARVVDALAALPTNGKQEDVQAANAGSMHDIARRVMQR